MCPFKKKKKRKRKIGAEARLSLALCLICLFFEFSLDRSTAHAALNHVSTIMYKLACASVENSDLSAHLLSLIRVFNWRSICSQGSNISSGQTQRL